MSADDLKTLESSLSGLIPIAALNRDRLLFEAGRQSARRHSLWPTATAALACLSAVLGLQLLLQPEPATRTVVVHGPAKPVTPQPEPKVEVPVAIEANHTPDWGNAFRTSTGYLSRRDQILHFGPESLPPAPPMPDALPDPQQGLKAHSL